MSPKISRAERYGKLKEMMEENIRKATRSSVNNVCRITRRPPDTPPEPREKYTFDELAEIFQEQALFKKYPDFHDYVKKTYPGWFETDKLINLKREYRKDFMQELDFFDIQGKNNHHEPGNLFKKSSQSQEGDDDTDFCAKCYCRHIRDPEDEGDHKHIKTKKSKKNAKKQASEKEKEEENDNSCDLDVIRQALAKLMEDEGNLATAEEIRRNMTKAQSSTAERVATNSSNTNMPTTSNAYIADEKSSDADGDDESSSSEQDIPSARSQCKPKRKATTSKA